MLLSCIVLLCIGQRRIILREAAMQPVHTMPGSRTTHSRGHPLQPATGMQFVWNARMRRAHAGILSGIAHIWLRTDTAIHMCRT